MMKILQNLALICILAIIAVACSKEENDVEITPEEGKPNYAQIDGADFNVTLASGLLNPWNLIISMDGPNETAITLMLPNTITVGTYDIGDMNSEYKATYRVSSTEVYGSTTGKLTITTFDSQSRKAEGTFSFEAKSYADASLPVRKISNGKFSVIY